MSQKSDILKYLQDGNTLTGLQGLTLFGSLSIRNRISELRREGYNIQDRIIHDKRTGKHYSEYFLSDEPLPTEQESAVIENHLAQETPINLKEVNKQLCFV
jgi:hypothetical protein